MNYPLKKQNPYYVENEYVEFWIEDEIIYEVIKPQITSIDLEMV